LFLDEIDALPLSLQHKLLKAIEEKRIRRLGAVREHLVDVKLIAATQTELHARMSEGRFRADLYHRLAVILLHIPPLRERGEDILVLAQEFLRHYAEAHGLIPKQLSPKAEAWLQSYAWPGNVRELSHVMERVTLLHPEVFLDASSLERLCLGQPQPAAPAGEGVAQGDGEPQDEPTRIRRALIQSGGNVVRASRLLGLSRDAVRYRMRQYGIQRPLSELFAPLAGAPGRGATSRQSITPHTARAVVRETGQGEEAAALAPAWEQKPMAVLAIELTWPAAVEGEVPRYEP
jgi:DNA-binding NtrC family response regulator